MSSPITSQDGQHAAARNRPWQPPQAGQRRLADAKGVEAYTCGMLRAASLASWRCTGAVKIPGLIRVGRKCLYDLDAIDAFLNSRCEQGERA